MRRGGGPLGVPVSAPRDRDPDVRTNEGTCQRRDSEVVQQWKGGLNEPLSPELAAQGWGSARRCGKDGRGVGVARMGDAPPCTASDLPAPSRRSWPVRGPSW